jgi:hypothetical protein
MDSLTYDNQSTPGMMDALIEMLRMKRQQPPQGVGPVASGDTYGEMLRPREAGSIPWDVGQPAQGPVESAPIDQIIAAMTPGKSDLAMAGMGREVAGFGLAPATSKLDGMPANEPVYQKKEQPAEVVTEQPAEPVALPEIAVSLMAQARDEVAKTPEQKQQLDQALTKKDTDGMSIGQKMATIAMAIAPTLVGYAAHGNKGAYLGAAATGKGLSAGVDEHQKEEKMKQAIDIARLRQAVKGSVAEKAGKPGGETEDASGFVFKYAASGQLKPVMLPDGSQLRRSNAPRTMVTPSGQTITTTPFEGKQQFETAEPSTEGLKTIGDRVKSKESAWASIGRKPSVPEEFSRYQNINPDDPSTPKSLRERYYKWETKDVADLAKAQEADIAAKSRVKVAAEKKPSVDTIGRKQQISNINKFRDTTYAKDMAKIKEMELWASNGFDTQVENAALYFKYMKEVQGDDSVIREGDQRTIESYFNIGTKLGQIGAVLDNKGRMSEELKTDMLKFLRASADFKKRQLAMTTNSYVNEAAKTNSQMAEWAMTDMDAGIKSSAREFARQRLESAQKLTKQQIADGVAGGTIDNGTMYYDSVGNPFVHQGIMYRMEGNKPRMINAGYPVRWRIK